MLEESQMHYNRLLNTYLEAADIATSGVWKKNKFLNSVTERFTQGMNDDFNTRIAFVEVQSVIKKLQELISSGNKEDSISAFLGWLDEFAGDVLGLIPGADELNTLAEDMDKKRNDISVVVEELLIQRQKAREEKNWEYADEIRGKLNSMNVIVEDSPQGPKWKIED
jgi:cysteinyl-tRNA synthetase